MAGRLADRTLDVIEWLYIGFCVSFLILAVGFCSSIFGLLLGGMLVKAFALSGFYGVAVTFVLSTITNVLLAEILTILGTGFLDPDFFEVVARCWPLFQVSRLSGSTSSGSTKLFGFSFVWNSELQDRDFFAIEQWLAFFVSGTLFTTLYCVGFVLW